MSVVALSDSRSDTGSLRLVKPAGDRAANDEIGMEEILEIYGLSEGDRSDGLSGLILARREAGEMRMVEMDFNRIKNCRAPGAMSVLLNTQGCAPVGFGDLFRYVLTRPHGEQSDLLLVSGSSCFLGPEGDERYPCVYIQSGKKVVEMLSFSEMRAECEAYGRTCFVLGEVLSAS